MKVINTGALRIDKGSQGHNLLQINELKILRTLHHPNIVAIKEIIIDPSHMNLYLIMQYISGKDLQDKIDEANSKGKPICRVFLWQIARQLISAIYTCHVDQQLYHRDIKPANIVLDDNNDIVLVDFGLSSHFEDDNDRLNSTQGTALYYAPEIVRTGIPDKKVYGRKIDIWAMGVTLYYLATGVHPFPATNVFMYQKKVLT